MKIWDDDDNQYGMRPANLRVTLSNGHSYTLNEGNGWSITVDGLPAEENGVPITYTWTEQSVPGYVCTASRTAGGTTVFVNRYRPVILPGMPSGGGGTPIAYFDEYETALAIRVVINHVGDCYE